jgi:glycosyltransferase involved in cell wall biosynthesis
LGECVKSVREQTRPVDAHVIVDDCSTDETTFALLDIYEADRERICTVEFDRNRGLPWAQNYGVQQTLTDFFIPLSADDKLHPEMVEKTLAAIGDHAVCYTDLQCFGAYEDSWETPDTFPSHDYKTNNRTPATALYRRSAWDAVGGYNEKDEWWCDWGLYIELAKAGFTGVRVPEKLTLYGRHDKNRSNRRSPEERERLEKLIRENHGL